MITFYGWGPMFDCPSPSPFVMKADMQLQMLGVEFYRAFADLDAVPKHKAPYVNDGDLLIEDSNFIRAHFERKLGVSLIDGLDDEQRAAAWGLERMAEGDLLGVIIIERWMKDENFAKGPAQLFEDVPLAARSDVIKGARDSLAAGMYQRGLSRHSEAERMQLAAWDLEALACQLGAKPYLFGDEPTAADASVASVLISGATPFFDTPLTALVRNHSNLADYMDRIKARYFARNVWPSFEMV